MPQCSVLEMLFRTLHKIKIFNNEISMYMKMAERLQLKALIYQPILKIRRDSDYVK